MTRHALVVSSQIEGLLGADRDAERTADALTGRGFAVDLRQGARATRAGILDGLDAVAARSEPGDPVVIFYAGHGSRLINPEPRDGESGAADVPRVGLFIAPTDYRQSAEDDFRGISAWELSVKLAAITGRTDNVTVILDCCHAAQMMRGGEHAGAVARTLPWPHKQGIGRYLHGLRAAGIDLSSLDPLGNPDAVRLFACGEGQAAWELDTPSGRTGALTEALLWALVQLRDHVVGWNVLGAVIRERVQRRFATQRPELGGPVRRAVFSTEVQRATRVAVRRTLGRAEVLAGTLVGTQVGDTFDVVPLPILDAPPLARATVTRALPLTSSVELDRWTVDPSTVLDDTLAVPRTRQLPAAPVRIAGEATAALRGRLAGTGRLRAWVEHDDEPPLATVDVGDGVAVVIDELGERTSLPTVGASRAATEEALDVIVLLLTDLAVARALRMMEGAVGLSAEAIAVTWGAVVGGVLVRRPLEGATLTLDERVAVAIENRSTTTLFVHVFDLGVDRQLTRVTEASTTGVPVAGGARWALGGTEHVDLVGFAQGWPPTIERQHPRREELIVIVTGTPVDLGVLETHRRAARAALPAAVSGLARLCTQLHSGGVRSVGPSVDESYVLVRIGFWVDPGPTTAAA